MITGSISVAFVIGGPELAILLLMALVLVGLILGILAIVKAADKKRARRSQPSALNPTQSRLQELDRLLSSETITQSEYDERRQKIIDDL